MNRLSPRRFFRSLPSGVQQVLEWLLIVSITIALVVLTREWLRFLLLPLALVLFLRVADRVPVVGPIWRWLFGTRNLWDWLTLLFIPLALAVIGLQVSQIFNAQRSDGDVEKTRFDAVEKYLTSLASTEILPAETPLNTASNAEALNALEAVDDGVQSGCGFSQPRAVTAASLTQAIASNLTNLRKSLPDKQIQKKIILEYLYARGLINRRLNEAPQAGSDTVISLRHVDMSSGNFYQARLPKACLNSVMFADSAGSEQSSSDFRFADLQGANLSGSNLARANLRNANLRDAVLTDWASLYKADLRGADLRGIKFDKHTTFDGAIFNTRAIKSDHDREGWLGSLLCGRQIRIIDTSGICMDEKDYMNIPPTQFPNEFYAPGHLDPETKLPTRLSQSKVKRLAKKIPLSLRNDLP